MSAEPNASVVRQSWERYEARDFAGSRACFADTFVAHVTGYPGDVSMEEYEAQGRMWSAAFPDFSITFEDVLSEGDRVAVRACIRGTHRGNLMGIPATGTAVELEGVFIDKVENGLIVERWAYWDLLGMMQQLGLMPPLSFAETRLGQAALWLATKPKAVASMLLGGASGMLLWRRLRRD